MAGGGREPGWQAAAEILSSHPDPAERIRAARELGRAGEDRAIAALAAALRDPVKGVRAGAAAALACTGSPAVPALLRALADDSWVVRYRAAEALGFIRDPRSSAALALALGDGRDHVRYMAAKGLGRLPARGAAGALREALHDENPFVRRAAKAALDALG